MKNLRNLGKTLTKSEQKKINGGKTGDPLTCPGSSFTYGEWLYSTLGQTGPGAPCAFKTLTGNCYGVVQSNGSTCTAS